MRAQFSYSPIVPAPLEKVWALYPDANSINKISPPFARVNFARLDLPLRAGAEIILADKYSPPQKKRGHAKIAAVVDGYFAYRHRRTMILL